MLRRYAVCACQWIEKLRESKKKRKAELYQAIQSIQNKMTSRNHGDILFCGKQSKTNSFSPSQSKIAFHSATLEVCDFF